MSSNKLPTVVWKLASLFAAATSNLFASRSAIIVAGFCSESRYAVFALLYASAAVILLWFVPSCASL